MEAARSPRLGKPVVKATFGDHSGNLKVVELARVGTGYLTWTRHPGYLYIVNHPSPVAAVCALLRDEVGWGALPSGFKTLNPDAWGDLVRRSKLYEVGGRELAEYPWAAFRHAEKIYALFEEEKREAFEKSGREARRRAQLQEMAGGYHPERGEARDPASDKHRAFLNRMEPHSEFHGVPEGVLERLHDEVSDPLWEGVGLATEPELGFTTENFG